MFPSPMELLDEDDRGHEELFGHNRYRVRLAIFSETRKGEAEKPCELLLLKQVHQ